MTAVRGGTRRDEDTGLRRSMSRPALPSLPPDPGRDAERMLVWGGVSGVVASAVV
jgi:hypothetical protein